jgi:uncharacterized protein (TIGR02246 family)
MKRLATLCAAASIALMSTACNQTSANPDADAQAIRTNEAQWNQEYASKDTDKVVAHYADDAVLMAPGTPPSVGKEAIRTALKQMTADPALSLKFQPTRVEVSKSGDFAFSVGTYTLTITDPQTKQVINDHGSYVTTYRKQPDGSWKAVADIATSEVPPPAPAPAKTP